MYVCILQPFVGFWVISRSLCFWSCVVTWYLLSCRRVKVCSGQEMMMTASTLFRTVDLSSASKRMCVVGLLIIFLDSLRNTIAFKIRRPTMSFIVVLFHRFTVHAMTLHSTLYIVEYQEHCTHDCLPLSPPKALCIDNMNSRGHQCSF